MSVSNAGGSVVFFGLRLNFFRDKKILLLEERFGENGEKACFRLLKLWAYIYSQGNYIDWDDDDRRLYCKTDGVDREFTDQLIEECLKLNLFNIPLYEKYNILTSRFIQEEYMAATANKNQITLVWDYLILDPEVKCKDTTRRKVFFTNRSGKDIKRDDLKKYQRINTDYEKPMPLLGLRPEINEAIDAFCAPIQKDTVPEKIVEHQNEEFDPADNDLYSFDEAVDFCKLDYEDQKQELKNQIKKEWYNSYKTVIEYFKDEFKNLKISTCHLTFAQYKKLMQKAKPMYSKVEMYQTLETLSRDGRFTSKTVVHLKLKQYLEITRKDNEKAEEMKAAAKKTINSGVPMLYDARVQKQSE